MKYRSGVVHARNAWSDKYKFWEVNVYLTLIGIKRID